MLVLTVISLYTSRVVLQTLGVEDYGIYNIVSGVIVMFTFISNSMATGTQRHISFELGKTDGDVSKVFSACFNVHLLLALLVVVLGETIGLWFLNTQLVIPEDRMGVARIVYQFAIFSTFFSIVLVPFNASIIAYERFSFYAYSSILEGALKLIVAISLLYISFDKLIVYSLLNFLVVIVLLLVVAWYVFRRIKTISFVKVHDKSFYKYIFNFTGWTIFGSCANIVQSQGLNILINMFYGVVLNAAVGVSSQVQHLFNKISGALQQSLNPQLVKAEAGTNKKRQLELICRSSKFTFAILLVCALPIMTHLDIILKLWLGTVPEYTSQITVFVIVSLMLESLSSPLYTTVYAIGKIKKYQIVISGIKILTILIAFIIAKCGSNPSAIYIAPCIISVIALCYRLRFLSKSIDRIESIFIKQVILPLTLGLIIGIIPCFVIRYLSYEISIPLLFVHLFLEFVYSCTVIFFVSLSASERQGILQMGKDFMGKFKKK
jgi:O-antigen/teichoic acid export membrane protein